MTFAKMMLLSLYVAEAEYHRLVVAIAGFPSLVNIFFTSSVKTREPHVINRSN